jgi:glutathione synthase
MRVGVYIDQLEKLNLSKDSTIDLIRTGTARGHEIAVFHPLGLTGSTEGARAQTRAVRESAKSASGLEFGDLSTAELDSFGVILVRSDPPFDSAYLAGCHLLVASGLESRMVNRPSGILATPEKLFPIRFPELHPPTIVTSDWKMLDAFRREHGDLVLKPLYDFCGNGVFRVSVSDKNCRSMFETLIRLYQTPLVVQKYLPEVVDGDKRIFLVAGKAVAAISRLPPEDDIRANMFVGGVAIPATLTNRDLEICEQIGPELLARGIFFAGVDVIGGFLTEVNVASPTGIIQTRELCGVDVGERLWTWIEQSGFVTNESN